MAFRVEFDLYCPHHIMGNRWAEHIHSSSTYQDHLQPTRTTSSSPGQSPNHQDHLPPTNTHPWLYFRLSILRFALLTGALGMNHALPGEHQPWMRAASTALSKEMVPSNLNILHLKDAQGPLHRQDAGGKISKTNLSTARTEKNFHCFKIILIFPPSNKEITTSA